MTYTVILPKHKLVPFSSIVDICKSCLNNLNGDVICILFKENAFGFKEISYNDDIQIIHGIRNIINDETYILFNLSIEFGKNIGFLISKQDIIATDKKYDIDYNMSGHIREMKSKYGTIIDGRLCKEVRNGVQENGDPNRIILVSSGGLPIKTLSEVDVNKYQALFLNEYFGDHFTILNENWLKKDDENYIYFVKN